MYFIIRTSTNSTFVRDIIIINVAIKSKIRHFDFPFGSFAIDKNRLKKNAWTTQLYNNKSLKKFELNHNRNVASRKYILYAVIQHFKGIFKPQTFCKYQCYIIAGKMLLLWWKLINKQAYFVNQHCRNSPLLALLKVDLCH